MNSSVNSAKTSQVLTNSRQLYEASAVNALSKQLALKVQLKLILKQPALAKLWFQWVLIHFYTDFLLLKINFTQLDTKMDNIGILNGSNQNQLYGRKWIFFAVSND